MESFVIECLPSAVVLCQCGDDRKGVLLRDVRFVGIGFLQKESAT